MKRIVIRKLVKPPRWGIVWFPEFSAQTAQSIANIARIAQEAHSASLRDPLRGPATVPRTVASRNAHDPLAATLAPHLWLVFPFAAHLNVTQLVAHIRRRTARWPQVPVVFSGIRNLKDEFVLLNARTGAGSVVALHDRLYGGILAPYLRDDMDYPPHVTLARSTDPQIFASALDMAESNLSGEHRALLGHVSLLSLTGEGVHLSPRHRVTEVARIPLG